MSVQGELAKGKSFIWGWGAFLQLPLVSLVSVGGGTKAVGKSGLGGYVSVQHERVRRVCNASVQGEKCFIWGRGAVLQLPLAASLHKSKGEWWVGVGGLGM